MGDEGLIYNQVRRPPRRPKGRLSVRSPHHTTHHTREPDEVVYAHPRPPPAAVGNTGVQPEHSVLRLTARGARRTFRQAKFSGSSALCAAVSVRRWLTQPPVRKVHRFSISTGQRTGLASPGPSPTLRGWPAPVRAWLPRDVFLLPDSLSSSFLAKHSHSPPGEGRQRESHHAARICPPPRVGAEQGSIAQ